MPNPTPIIHELDRSPKVLITTHVRPDGDALGSTAALALACRAKNIQADILLLSRLPSKYAFIYDDSHIRHFEISPTGDWPQGLDLNTYPTVAVVDTGTWSQLPGLKDRVEAFKGRKLVIDHHLTQESWADVKLVDTSAAAAGEIIERLLNAWSVPLTPQIAAALFLAIASDTGWFQFSNTRPDTLRVAAELMDAGVDTDRMYQLLYQNERAERIKLQTRAIQSLELLENGRLAVMKLRKRDFEETGGRVPDTENVINFPLQIRSVAVSVLLTDPPEPGPVRISFRSKGQLDVAKFAEQFGGGGHARASGAKLPGTLEQAESQILAAMRTAMKDLPQSTPQD